jgi:hypothetical protein
VRKLSSAILIFILLFNLFGYRFVADYIQAKNDKQLEARLDDNRFDNSQLIELKVPINLPYQTTWSDFERYNGEVEINGILYKYVKRKVVNDTLVLLCIPNHEKMDLRDAKNDFFKNTNDLAQSNGSKKSDNSKAVDFKKLVTEYDQHSNLLSARKANYDQRIFGYTKLVVNLPSSPHISPEQPPDLISA